MKIVLNIDSKKSHFKTFLQVNQSITIGRSEEAAIRVDDERVSSIHALIEFNQNGLCIHDKQSKNGLFINDLKIDQSRIYQNDKVKLGNTLITINQTESDKEALSILIYPGIHGTRMTQELQIGSPVIKAEKPKVNKLVKEILEGNKPRKRVTKEKLKQIYPSRFKMASVIDLIILFVLALIPFLLVKELKIAKTPLPVSEGTLIAILECLLIPTVVIRNKRKDFTFGEQIVGLVGLYDKEND